MNYTFASDNSAGICPEALAALNAANTGHVASYGDDPITTRAKSKLRELFETDCEVFFVFNGTAANSLALSSACQSHQSIFCHEHAHADTDECAAPEFFTGGSKVIPLSGENGKLDPAAIEAATQRGHGIHYPKPGAITFTQSTELGTVYTLDEIQALAEVAKRHSLTLHMDGARFANAMVALRKQSENVSPADATWRAGVDVMSFGGTKNGMHTTEAIVFFNRELARDFDYRIKQSGQLASKQRFAAAQWTAMLENDIWLGYAAHSDAMAQRLSSGLADLPGCRLQFPTEVNGVFIEMPPKLFAGLAARGWEFYPFVGPQGYRLMCGWDTQPEEVDALIVAARELTSA
jgi:threonine aldolase